MCFFFQAEDGIRYLVRSRGLGDVYKRQLDEHLGADNQNMRHQRQNPGAQLAVKAVHHRQHHLSLIHI